eukprot:10952262-Alexandrium_andersonii.AAC.1
MFTKTQPSAGIQSAGTRRSSPHRVRTSPLASGSAAAPGALAALATPAAPPARRAVVRMAAPAAAVALAVPAADTAA